MKKATILFVLLLQFLGASSQTDQNKVDQIASTDGQLTVKLTNADPALVAGGQPATKHVLAIWLQDNSGLLVNTLLYYTANGNSSATHLHNWYSLITNNNSLSWSASQKKTTADAVTGATQPSYLPRTCYWGKTVNLSSIQDGTYKIKVDLATEYAFTTDEYTFVKGPNSQQINPTDKTCFKTVSITWTPRTANELRDVELSKLYTVYPCPAKDAVYVSGYNIDKIDLCNLSGGILKSSLLPQLDISKFSAGFYLLRIYTTKGQVVTKKIEKR